MIYIAQLAQSSLYLGNSEVLAEIDAWLEFIQTSLEPALMNWTYPFLGVTEPDQKVVDKASGDVKKQLKELDKGFKKSNFLCGGELTIADISLACALVLPLRTVLDEKFLKGLKVLMKWFERVSSMPQFINVWGPIKFCKQPLELAVQKKPEKKESKKQPKKKTEKKTEKKTGKKTEKKTEKEEKKQTSSQNPLDLLPETQLNLDSWKKLYSNTEDKKAVMQEFWKMYDPQGWSIYHLHYQKLEGEGQKLYMTANRVEGFLARMERLRKYSFGTMGVYGEEPDLEILAVFMWRGKGIPAEVNFT